MALTCGAGREEGRQAKALRKALRETVDAGGVEQRLAEAIRVGRRWRVRNPGRPGRLSGRWRARAPQAAKDGVVVQGGGRDGIGKKRTGDPGRLSAVTVERRRDQRSEAAGEGFEAAGSGRTA